MTSYFVGVDGSDHAVAALQWAASRAQRGSEQVVAFFAWNTFDQGHHEKGEKLKADFGDADALEILSDTAARAGVSDNVELRNVQGVPAEAIVAQAKSTDVIVVGARGLGGFKGLLLGSVSLRILQLAECPVIVIHGTTAPAFVGDVVVGVDGSEPATAALHWAATEARTIGVGLRIVRAWQAPSYPGVVVPEVFTALEDAAVEEVRLAAQDPVLEGLTVTTETPCSNAAAALLDHGDASMIVVGHRGLGAMKRAFLGSVSHQVVRHATVPVAVV